VDLRLVGQALRLGRLEGLVERGRRVGIQVVHDQDDPLGVRAVHVDQLLDDAGPIQLGSPVGHRVTGVVHSTERSDGSVHETFNYKQCVTNKVDRKVVSTYCEQRHDTYLLKGDEPQVVHLSNTEDVRSLGETCRVRTVYHFVNGDLRIDRIEFLGNCRVPD
jgi:hypothetical protein